ncbi:MAG: DsbA family protein [Kofleriaceae bacterium]
MPYHVPCPADRAPRARCPQRNPRVALLILLRTRCLCALALLIAPGLAACSKSPSAEQRLARLERRVDKLVAALEQALPPPEPDPATVYSVPLAPGDLVEGPADARLTLVEGFEFACPYCYAAQPLLAELRARHPRDLRVVSKYYLVHGEPAIPAGLAVCAAAKQGKATELKEALWRKVFTVATPQGKPELAPIELGDAAVVATAAELGLDPEQLRRDMADASCEAWVRAGGPALEQVGAAGTPAFYLNGRPLATLDLESAEALIAEELRRVDRAVASGVDAAAYYDVAVVKGGQPRVRGRFDE